MKEHIQRELVNKIMDEIRRLHGTGIMVRRDTISRLVNQAVKEDAKYAVNAVQSTSRRFRGLPDGVYQ